MFCFVLGTDTVKRGVSPALGLSSNSLSNGRIRESTSNYSIKQENTNSTIKEARDFFNSLERSNKLTNNIYNSRNVLFASDAIGDGSSRSASSYSLHEIKSPKSPNPMSSLTSSATSATISTSQLIKQTLSPLAQHRNISQSNLDTNLTTTNNKNQMNNSISSSTLGTYQFPSSSLNLKNITSLSSNENHLSSPLPTRKPTIATSSASALLSSSPSRSISNTNTLPSSVARNMLYQSDSNYSLKNQQQLNYASPGNNGIGGTSSAHAQTNNIYGTLPKNSSPFSGTSSYSSSLYSNNITSTSTDNEFDKLIARYQTVTSTTAANTGSGTINNSYSTGNYNTLGSYRVQYSSTNPFLPSFNPNSNATE